MIKVKLTKNNNYYKRIIITGHANYDDFGKDIVCASVSSIIYTTVNGLLNINEKSIEFLDNDEYMEIKVLLSDDITNSLILNMMTMLKEIEKCYPKNIKVNEE